MLESTGTFTQHKVRLETEPVGVNADETRMAQVIDNLITNAVKYTPAGGSVMVAVLCEGDDAVIRVADTGIGISPSTPASDLRSVRPGRANAGSGQRRFGNRTDAGEAAGGDARRICQRVQRGPGRGSAFTVRLPRVAVPAEQSPPGSIRTAAGDARRVLLVEDSADVRRMLRLRLELDGHEVHEADDGNTGLAEAFRLQPDVAVIDIGLPGLDGWELTRRLRTAEAGRRMILVAISGDGQLEDQQLSREAGFDVHLVKPVDLDTLTAAIHGVSLRTVGHA